MCRPTTGAQPKALAATASRTSRSVRMVRGISGSGAVRNFALYGETTGETDELGLPVRYDWAAEYRGKAMVVYGHTPVAEPEWLASIRCGISSAQPNVSEARVRTRTLARKPARMFRSAARSSW